MVDVDPGAALCAPFLAHLPVEGVSVAVVSGKGAVSTVGASDAVAVRLEGLQFQLGEGPIRDALRTGRAVLAPDLAAAEALEAWPVFSPAARRAGAGALHSFPMFLGTTPIGVVSLHARASGSVWDEATIRTARVLTAATAQSAIDLASRSAAAEAGSCPQQAELRREVHQAAGMVMVQLDGGIDEAMARLRGRAFAEDRPLDALARDVVAGAATFAGGED